MQARRQRKELTSIIAKEYNILIVSVDPNKSSKSATDILACFHTQKEKAYPLTRRRARKEKIPVETKVKIDIKSGMFRRLMGIFVGIYLWRKESMEGTQMMRMRRMTSFLLLLAYCLCRSSSATVFTGADMGFVTPLSRPSVIRYQAKTQQFRGTYGKQWRYFPVERRKRFDPICSESIPSSSPPSSTSPTVPNPSPQQNRQQEEDLFFEEVDVLYGRRSSLIYDPVQERYVKATGNDDGGGGSKGTTRSSSSHAGTTETNGGTVVSVAARRMRRFFREKMLPALSVAFVPGGVTDNYYRFMMWRIAQRFVNGNLHVFGTQSLLLGLGMKQRSDRMNALAAAFHWVFKDALGKIVRMVWASKMGRRFDSDAKRWRFRSSFVYAAGNGFEIITYIFPQWFLLWATVANCCKQVSMLTSSSTRTAIYNSFRDGSRENIGDITAKGEAQIAIVDLMGIATGVCLSRTVGTKVRSILLVYLSLQLMEIFCVYRQLRSVRYRVLNLERMVTIITNFCRQVEGEGTETNATATHTEGMSMKLDSAAGQRQQHGAASANATELIVNRNITLPEHSIANGSIRPNNAARSSTSTTTRASTTASGSRKNRDDNMIPKEVFKTIPTPEEMAGTERIFLPPEHLCRRGIAFGSLGRTRLSPTELHHLLRIFKGERYLLVVGANVKKPSFGRVGAARVKSVLQSMNHAVRLFLRTRGGTIQQRTASSGTEEQKPMPAREQRLRDGQVVDRVNRIQENCHIVLHTDATNMDIVKSTLALILLRRNLAAAAGETTAGTASGGGTVSTDEALPLFSGDRKCLEGGCQNSQLGLDSETIRSLDCLDLIESSQEEASRMFAPLLRQLTKRGWESPARFMFGRVHMRAGWPLQKKSQPHDRSAKL